MPMVRWNHVFRISLFTFLSVPGLLYTWWHICLQHSRPSLSPSPKFFQNSPTISSGGAYLNIYLFRKQRQGNLWFQGQPGLHSFKTRLETKSIKRDPVLNKQQFWSTWNTRSDGPSNRPTSWNQFSILVIFLLLTSYDKTKQRWLHCSSQFEHKSKMAPAVAAGVSGSCDLLSKVRRQRQSNADVSSLLPYLFLQLQTEPTLGPDLPSTELILFRNNLMDISRECPLVD